jgi:hypothetical protein
MCLTTVSLFLETACLPGLVFCLLLVPILRHGQGHALLSYTVQRDDWDGTEVFRIDMKVIVSLTIISCWGCNDRSHRTVPLK